MNGTGQVTNLGLPITVRSSSPTTIRIGGGGGAKVSQAEHLSTVQSTNPLSGPLTTDHLASNTLTGAEVVGGASTSA